MSNDYNPNSVPAVLSRLETKLDNALARQAVQEQHINRLWAALGRIDVRVAAVAATVSAVGAFLAWLLKF